MIMFTRVVDILRRFWTGSDLPFEICKDGGRVISILGVCYPTTCHSAAGAHGVWPMVSGTGRVMMAIVVMVGMTGRYRDLIGWRVGPPRRRHP